MVLQSFSEIEKFIAILLDEMKIQDGFVLDKRHLIGMLILVTEI